MLKAAQKIFVIGIGGIGISALARVLKAQGKRVSGSDIAASELTVALAKEGIAVEIGQRAENLPNDTELLIYSTAVPGDNPKRKRARELRIPELSYPQAVGELSRGYEKVVAVAGTNGKTTTTAMIGWILEQAGLDPTVIVGSEVLAWKSNARVGQSKYLVIEADEYKRAFLNYEPNIAVITNIAADHLDYYKDLKDVKKAFAEFVSNLKPGGRLISNPSPGDGEGEGRERSNYHLKFPGKFNQQNAAAAAAASRALGVHDEIIRKALETFTGTWRRFELVGKFGNTDIVSDYAHHPTGTTATMQAAAEIYKPEKTLIVFQPHQHNRTKMLFKEFVKSFCAAPQKDFIIAEIFDVAGREESQDQDISSQDLVREIRHCGKNVRYAANLQDAEKQIRAISQNYDAILIMGAGDIYKVANSLAATQISH